MIREAQEAVPAIYRGARVLINDPRGTRGRGRNIEAQESSSVIRDRHIEAQAAASMISDTQEAASAAISRRTSPHQ